MATLQNRSGERRSEPRTKIPSLALIDEIAEALLDFGGSAHRDLVIVRVAARRGLNEVPDRLRRDLMNTFDAHRASAAGNELLLCLPFGEESRRWALTAAAREITCGRLRDGMVAATSVEPLARSMADSLS